LGYSRVRHATEFPVPVMTEQDNNIVSLEGAI